MLSNFVISRSQWGDSEVIEEIPEILSDTSSTSTLSTTSVVTHAPSTPETTTMVDISLKNLDVLEEKSFWERLVEDLKKNRKII